LKKLLLIFAALILMTGQAWAGTTVAALTDKDSTVTTSYILVCDSGTATGKCTISAIFALDTVLTPLRTLGGANTLVGVNSAGDALEFKSTFNHLHLDDAAQFGSSTANKGTLQFLLTSTTAGQVSQVTIPDADGTMAYTTGTQSMALTGSISGKVPMITKTSAYTLGTDSAQEAYGYVVWLTGDGTVLTLPAVVAGMSVCVYSADTLDKVIDPNQSDGIRNATTTRNADGHAMVSGATDQGSFACLVADSADGWTVLSRFGTWTDD
jgi:hypothetical protein